MFATISSSGCIRRLISTRGRAITSDTKISMARAIVGNRATSGSDQPPMYDQLLRPTTDRTINRGDRRPMVGSIVTRPRPLRPVVCDRSCEHSWRGRVHDQLWHPTVDRRSIVVQRSIARSIVASCDRSLRPTTGRTINRGTKRPIVRSIVARPSYDQSCDLIPIRDHPQLVVLPCTTGGTIT